MIILSICLSIACNFGPDSSVMKWKWLDVDCAKTSSAQKLDIYLPNEGDGPFPVRVFIQGGGFEFGDSI